MESNVNKEENESLSNNVTNIRIDDFQHNSEEKTKFELTIESINKGTTL